MYSTYYRKKQTATPRRSALLASMKKNSISSLTNKIKNKIKGLRKNGARTLTPTLTPMINLMIVLLWDAYPVKEKKLRGRTLEKFVPNWNGIKMKLTDGSYESISVRKMANFFLNPDNSRNIIQQHACEALKKAARNEVSSQTTGFRKKEALKFPDYADGNKYHVGHDYEEGERFIEIFQMFCEQLNRGTKIEVKSEVKSTAECSLADAISQLSLAQPEVGVKKMVTLLKEQYPQLNANTKDVRAALTQVKAAAVRIYKFKNKLIAEKWAAYHQKNAILRIESATDNLKGNKGFRKKNQWLSAYISR